VIDINTQHTIISWLMEGDIAIQYQVNKRLLNTNQSDLFSMKNHIHLEGYAKQYLDLRDPLTFKWGKGIYSPKWISTHYTLLELKNMEINPLIPEYQESVQLLLKKMWFNKGQVNKYRHQDMCVVAMILSMVTYGKMKVPEINEMIDYILDHQFEDGGWNCMWESKKHPSHSSLHTTLSVLEAFHDLELNGYLYQQDMIKKAVIKGNAFMLRKHLFRSERTHEIIHPSMLNFPYPSRWKYDILRALEYFSSIHHPYDDRMEEAIDIIRNKMKTDGTWGLETAHSGLTHFKMEHGKSSRWNTMRALSILKNYDPKYYEKLINR